MLVWIVYLPTADLCGPDIDRMNRVEDLPDDLARALINEGSARLPSDDEVAAYREALQVEEKAAEADDLTVLPKADLERMAGERNLEVPPRATKADLAAAIETHDKQQAETPAEPAP